MQRSIEALFLCGKFFWRKLFYENRVVNFAIYKAMLRVVDGYKDNLEILVQSECARYSNIFPILDTFHWPK